MAPMNDLAGPSGRWRDPTGRSSCVAHSAVYKKTGDVLSDSFTEGRWHFWAYFGVTAQCGGEHGRDLVSGVGEIIRRSFVYQLQMATKGVSGRETCV
ncbi:hypothetical protein LZ30DRAFT_785256 [Colletotrichum cereale]|nr:hypothetical protein LZ30DRAFT_785256 [Colletotrichum cereale]